MIRICTNTKQWYLQGLNGKRCIHACHLPLLSAADKQGKPQPYRNVTVVGTAGQLHLGRGRPLCLAPRSKCLLQ